MIIVIYGTYRFRPQRIAFRNDYCLACAGPRRSVQFRTFDAFHIFWIPLVPLGFHKRWRCAACGGSPHVFPGTRRGFKWAGLAVLLVLGATSWAVHLDPDMLIVGWVLRVAAPLGAILTLVYLLHTPKNPSLEEKLAALPAASETVCPFCGTAMLFLSSACSCPACGVVRSEVPRGLY